MAQIVTSGLAAAGALVTTGVDDHWQGQLQVEQVISRLSLDPRVEFDMLSAGLKRRVLLGRVLFRFV